MEPEKTITKMKGRRGFQPLGKTVQARNEHFLHAKKQEVAGFSAKMRIVRPEDNTPMVFWEGESRIKPNTTLGVFHGEYIGLKEFDAKFGRDGVAPLVVGIRDGDTVIFIDGTAREHWTNYVRIVPDAGEQQICANLKMNPDGRMITIRKIIPGEEVVLRMHIPFV